MSTEAAMCAEFMKQTRAAGWKIYPEWGGWDMLAVTARGVQVGIEAKLRANLRVLRQALHPAEHSPGPAYHAVLVPKVTHEFREVAGACRIYPITGPAPFRLEGPWSWCRPKDVWKWSHKKPAAVPPVEELNAPAGVPSPSALTPWKVKAMRLWLIMESRGWVTSRDFKAQGISPTTWVGRWIRWDGTKDGRLRRYVAVADYVDPRADQLHPDVMAALRNEAAS